MANTVKIKQSAVAARVPTTGDLVLGELALNTYDGKLYAKKDNGTASIIEIGAGGGGGSPNLDGGLANSAYSAAQNITGGNALGV